MNKHRFKQGGRPVLSPGRMEEGTHRSKSGRMRSVKNVNKVSVLPSD